jgi:5-methylcytosine-specific restriction endonuclease McrA
MKVVQRLISATQAKQQGKKRYFTGKPCPQGHICERMVSSNGCVECRRIQFKRWRTTHKDKFKVYRTRWIKKKFPEREATLKFKKTRRYRIEQYYKRLFWIYKHAAIKRGLLFELTLEQALRLFLGNCHYCGAPPSKGQKQIIRNVVTQASKNGIDRKNNKIGYTEKNCVSCCRRCNTMKSNLSYLQFKRIISQIFSHWLSNQTDK